MPETNGQSIAVRSADADEIGGIHILCIDAFGCQAPDRLPCYASSQHLPDWEVFGPDVAKPKKKDTSRTRFTQAKGNRRAAKPIPRYIGHMEEIELCRKTAGDDYILAHDLVQAGCLMSSTMPGMKIPFARSIWTGWWS